MGGTAAMGANLYTQMFCGCATVLSVRWVAEIRALGGCSRDLRGLFDRTTRATPTADPYLITNDEATATAKAEAEPPPAAKDDN